MGKQSKRMMTGKRGEGGGGGRLTIIRVKGEWE